ncbi:MAG: GtrA family protein [Dehalococcoidales bacterium]
MKILRENVARNIIIYITRRKLIMVKFLVVSGSAVAINLVLLFLMVRYWGFDTVLRENAANIISMEISIIYNFFLSRAFTWSDRHKEKGGRLVIQILKFHVAIGITLLFRAALFPILQHFGVYYIINAAIGIIIAAIFNFFIYDALIFRERGA